MEFTAFAFLSSPRLAFGAKSDLLFQILPDLKTAGVTLAGPTTSVRIDMTAPSPPATAP